MAPTSISEGSKPTASVTSANSSESDLSLKTSSGVSKKISPASLLRHPTDLLLTTTDNLRSSSEFGSTQQLPLDFSIRSNDSVTPHHREKMLPNVANSSQTINFANFLRPPMHNLMNFPHPLLQALQKQSYFNQRLLASSPQRLNVAPNRMTPTSQDIHLMRLEQQIGNLTQVVNQLAANQARFIHLPQRIQSVEQMMTRIAPHVDLLSKQFSNSLANPKNTSTGSTLTSSSTSSQRNSSTDSSEIIQTVSKSSLPSLLIPNLHDQVENVMKDDPLTSRSTSSAVDSIMNEVNNNSAESDSFEDNPFDLSSSTSTTPEVKSEVNGSHLSSDLTFTAGVSRSILSEIFPGNQADTKAMKYILPSHIPIEELRPDCKVHSVRIGPFVAPMDIFNIPPGDFEPVFRKYKSGSAFSQALFVLHHGSFLAMKSSASERGRNNQRILSNDFIHQLTQICRFWFPEAGDDSVAKAVNQKQRNILCSARHCFFYLKCEVCSEAKQETLKALKLKFEQYQNSQY